MARRIFVSYKYYDDKVAELYPFDDIEQMGTARDYVDLIMQTVAETEIYNGEVGDNDLSAFADETIRTHLKELIRSSSVTIVLVSKGMKDSAKAESEQWIPWEIQYSLTRRALPGGTRRSKRNGMLAVILPDENGLYSHYFQTNSCQHCSVVTHRTDLLFDMLGKNMFNLKAPMKSSCPNPQHAASYHIGSDHSYIHQVKWDDFIKDPSRYIDIAEARKEKVENYNLKKRV